MLLDHVLMVVHVIKVHLHMIVYVQVHIEETNVKLTHQLLVSSILYKNEI